MGRPGFNFGNMFKNLKTEAGEKGIKIKGYKISISDQILIFEVLGMAALIYKLEEGDKTNPDKKSTYSLKQPQGKS